MRNLHRMTRCWCRFCLMIQGNMCRNPKRRVPKPKRWIFLWEQMSKIIVIYRVAWHLCRCISVLTRIYYVSTQPVEILTIILQIYIIMWHVVWNIEWINKNWNSVIFFIATKQMSTEDIILHYIIILSAF